MKQSLSELDQKMAMLRQLTSELGAPTMPDLHIGVKLTDQNGKVLEDRYEQGHSWTRNAWCLYNSWMMDSTGNVAASGEGTTTYSPGYISVRRTDGGYSGSTSDGFLYYRTQYGDRGIQSTGSDSGFGIQVGTSDEPFDGEDHRLWGWVENGSGTGQLSYIGQSRSLPIWDPATKTFTTTYTRQMNNNSTTAIVIKEVGLCHQDGYLLSRDVLASPINVPVGAQLTISVSITTNAFTTIDASVAPYPAPGTAMGGGVWLGLNKGSNGWTNFPMNHNKYGLVVAPASFGENTLAYRTTNNTVYGTSDSLHGELNMPALYALGSASPIAEWCASVNSANAGGYSDWYIPSINELRYIMYNNRALLTGSDAFSNADYWSSYSGDASYPSYANTVNPITGTYTYNNYGKTTALKVRLVRRAKRTDV